jgi:8-oxo-dGTP pyrophosphatase MutT (NUDIX family)
MKKLWFAAGVAAFWVFWPYWRVHIGLGGTRARVMLLHDGKLLLVRSWLGAGTFELPGGGRHRGERFEQAAVRELKEETGITLQPDDLHELIEQVYREHGFKTRYRCFVAEIDDEPAIRTRWPEIAESAWVPLDDIGRLPLSKNVSAAVAAYRSKH